MICRMPAGVFYYYMQPVPPGVMSFQEFQIEYGIGFGAGTVFYWLGAMCLLCRQVGRMLE